MNSPKLASHLAKLSVACNYAHDIDAPCGQLRLQTKRAEQEALVP
jgi:hypothetical protein